MLSLDRPLPTFLLPSLSCRRSFSHNVLDCAGIPLNAIDAFVKSEDRDEVRLALGYEPDDFVIVQVKARYCLFWALRLSMRQRNMHTTCLWPHHRACSVSWLVEPVCVSEDVSNFCVEPSGSIETVALLLTKGRQILGSCAPGNRPTHIHSGFGTVSIYMYLHQLQSSLMVLPTGWHRLQTQRPALHRQGLRQPHSRGGAPQRQAAHGRGALHPGPRDQVHRRDQGRDCRGRFAGQGHDLGLPGRGLSGEGLSLTHT
jgi:hypothetical protein